MVLRPRGRGRVGHRRHLSDKAPGQQMAGGFVHHGVNVAVAFTEPTSCRHAFRAAWPPTVRHPRLYLSRMQRAGIVAVTGKPNAGKSTTLNRIVGEKLSITSAKPQSTRDRVVGIRTTDTTQ